MTDIEKLKRLADAIEQLKSHQTQLDMDGVMVGVSRQAIYEVVSHTDALLSRLERAEKALKPFAEECIPDHYPDEGKHYTAPNTFAEYRAAHAALEQKP